MDKINYESLPAKYYDSEKLTPFYYYRLYTTAKEYFKNKILELDTDSKYTTETTREVIDKKATWSNTSKYSDMIEFLDEKWTKYIHEHLDEFNEITVTDSSDEFTQTHNKFHFDRNISLQEAVIGYCICNSYLKESDKDILPKFISYRSKDEFKEKHQNIKKGWREENGIPQTEELTVKKVETRKQIKRFSKSNTPDISNDDIIKEYSDGYLAYLTEL